MRNTTLLLAFLASLFATSGVAVTRPHVVPARVGLVLVGATQQGMVLAADGSSLNADGRVSQEQKLFQAGRQGAIAISGTVSIQDPIGKRVREEVNVARIAGAWLASHPDADIQSANREVNAAIAAAVNKFFSTRSLGAQKGMFKFTVIAAGLVDARATVIVTRYFLPSAQGKTVRAEQMSTPCKPGDMWIFGSSSVPESLLNEKGNQLENLKANSADRKFHSSANLPPGEQDHISIFAHLLRAAESDHGKKVDAKRAIVAPPNRFATLTSKDGFTWAANPD
jgi:hypothetical protein